jgi:hypothetical protein
MIVHWFEQKGIKEKLRQKLFSSAKKFSPKYRNIALCQFKIINRRCSMNRYSLNSRILRQSSIVNELSFDVFTYSILKANYHKSSNPCIRSTDLPLRIT